MRTEAYRLVPVHDLVLPDWFPGLLDDPLVAALACSVDTFGLLEPITVRLRDKTVLFGFRRLAAVMRLQWDKVPTMLVTCTDEEYEALPLAHNWSSRNQRELDGFADRLNERFPTTEAAEAFKARTARRQVGKAKNLTVDALKNILSARAMIGLDAPKTAKPSRKFATATAGELVVLPGTHPSEMWRAQVTQALGLFAQVTSGLKELKRLADKLEDIPIAAKLAKLASKTIAAAVKTVDDAAPYGTCPYCKHNALAMELCVACGGSGFVAKAHFDNVPKRLLEDERLVCYRGNVLRVNDDGTFTPPNS